tara:strand:+ start:1534 stop:1980 length:447 start_codon:yes stop_codon:yes gene_type:complete
MKLIEPTTEFIEEVGFEMREADELEVRLSHDLDPLTAVIESAKNSDICKVIEGDNGNPVGLTGVTNQSIWLLGTDELTATKNHRKTLCIDGIKWVEYCLDKTKKPIGNWVYHENKSSIKWLKYLGFTVETPRPYGLSRALFCQFWRTN